MQCCVFDSTCKHLVHIVIRGTCGTGHVILYRYPRLVQWLMHGSSSNCQISYCVYLNGM